VVKNLSLGQLVEGFWDLQNIEPSMGENVVPLGKFLLLQMTKYLAIWSHCTDLTF